MICIHEVVKSPFKSVVKKSNFQTVIFAIIVVTMNGHDVYKLFKKILNDVQIKGKGYIIRLKVVPD